MAFSWRGRTYKVERNPQLKSREPHRFAPEFVIRTRHWTIPVQQEYGRNPVEARVQASRIVRRYAEFRLDHIGRYLPDLTPLERSMIRLERIALDPNAFPHERDKPSRPLSGVYLYSWIGARAGGFNARDTRRMLERIEVTLRLHEIAA